ncbi:MAG: exodeoxyribonuclease III [Acidimicrobiales bacterium]
MRLATWNVNSLKARLGRVEAWLAECEPDVLCLQETKLADDAFPALTFQALGYESVHHGQGRWNGVAILSRVGLREPAVGFAPGDTVVGDNVVGGEARIVSATCGGMRVASVYVPNGRALDDPQYELKLQWLHHLREHLEPACEATDPVVVCGDFNIAPTDDDVWDAAAVHGATHVSGPERDALRALEQLGLHDVFRRHHKGTGLYSWWDYRAGAFHKGLGMRIDLVLAVEALAEQSTWAYIDRNARKGEGPSDHAPVIVDFALSR